MTSNIQIETDKDRVVTTQPIPGLKVSMDNLEITEDVTKKPRIEIPEREPNRLPRTHDSDSSSDGQRDTGSDFKFLINPKKFNPLPKEELPAQTNNDDKRNDSASEKSKRSNHSRKSRFSGLGERRGGDSDTEKEAGSEYKPRISTIGSSFRPAFGPSSPVAEKPPAWNPFSPFNGRKSVESMTEDDIRKMKSNYLEQYEKKNKDFQYSPKKLSMKSDLEEIRSELEYITAKRRKENMMEMWKRGLVLFVDGAVMVNNYANDPFDVDLSDWSKEMHWDVFRAGKYDEVLEDLIEKYHQSKVPIAPEWKLAFMMGSSLIFGVMQKKQEKAKMKKRMEEERRMEEKVRNQVREEISRMQFMQQQQGHEGPSMMPQPPRGGVQHFPQQPYRPAPPMTTSQMAGPSTSLSDDKILKMMEANFIDSTIALDDSSVSTGSTKSSRASRATATQDATDAAAGGVVAPVKRGRGRPRKTDISKPKEDEVSKTADLTTEGGEKVITLPAPAVPKRGRGRPPKMTQADENVITLERL